MGKPAAPSPVEALALGKFDAKPYLEGAYPELGEHEVNCVVRVSGTITIAPPYEQLFVTTTDLARVLKVANLSDRTLETLVRRALGGQVLEDVKNYSAQLRELIGVHKARSACNGPVRGDVCFTRLAR